MPSRRTCTASTPLKRWACGAATTATTARMPWSCGPTRSAPSHSRQHSNRANGSWRSALARPRSDSAVPSGACRMPERVIMLIDGHSLVYRGFYALQELGRPFTNAKGELTTGVYAFTSMLLKAIEDLKPQYAAAAFDMSKPTFRLNDFAAYKGTRTAAPPGMRDQVTWSRRVLDAMQIPLFEVEGYEADDVIGALSIKGVEQGLQIIILSGDNDLLQLVNPHVKVLTSRRGITDTILYDEPKVIEKYGGLRPKQLPDFKAIRGDTTDNIPGVAGIGDKGAQKLLLDFGSVEALYENLDSEKVPRKQRDLLSPVRDQVLLAKRLTT